MKDMPILRAAFLLLCLFSSLFPLPAEAGKKESLRLLKINDDLKQLENDISLIKSEEEANLKRLEFIEKKIEQQNLLLKQLQKGLKENIAEKEKLKTGVQKLNRDILSHKKQLKKRLREVYKTSAVSELELLFSSGSLKDFLKNRTYLKAFALKDKREIEKFYLLLENKKRLQSLLAEKDADIRGAIQRTEEKKKDILAEQEKRRKLIEKLKSQKDFYFARKKKLEKEEKEVKRIIASFEKGRALRKKRRKTAGSSFKAHKGKLLWPLVGRVVTHFGRKRNKLYGTFTYHSGIEIVSRSSRNVRAVFAGRVLFSQVVESFGKTLILDHGNGYYSLYAYLSKSNVKVGQRVAEGERIARIGEHPRFSKPTLYFEIRSKSEPQNPEKWLR